MNHENENISGEFTYKNLSDCYYYICSFYKKYILQSATVDEASKENYDELISNIASVIKEVESIPDANSYDKLVAYNGVFMLLYDQRKDFAQSGIESAGILELVDNIYNSARSLDVKKEQTKKLQAEIVDNYKDYREAIERAYVNAEERALSTDNSAAEGGTNGR